MPYLTLRIGFGGDQPLSVDSVGVGLEGNAPEEGTLGGSEAVKAAAVALLGAATTTQQDELKRAALKHLEDSLP